MTATPPQVLCAVLDASI